MSQSSSQQDPSGKPRGKVDLVTILYIVGGIPAIVAYVVILFALVNAFPSIPA
jgi:uncharacterized membrane protein